MNKQILEEIQPVIRANAHAFVMGDYVTKRDSRTFREEILEPEKNICDSACCIAGTIVAHVDKVDLLQAYADVDRRSAIGDRAAEILGLGTDADDVDLFFLQRWPTELQRQYHYAQTDLERAEVGCQACRDFTEDPSLFSPGNDPTLDDEDDEDDTEDEEDDYDDEDDEEFGW